MVIDTSALLMSPGMASPPPFGSGLVSATATLMLNGPLEPPGLNTGAASGLPAPYVTVASSVVTVSDCVADTGLSWKFVLVLVNLAETG